MADITLEVPLPLFFFGRFFERHHPGAARIQVFHEPLDRAAFTGRVASLENHNDALTAVLDPVLHLQKFNLKLLLACLVLFTAHATLVGVVVGQPGAVAFRYGTLMQ